MKTKVICKWLLIVSSLLFSVVSYIFGYSFSSTNYNSFLLAASKYENGQYYTHVDIDYTESSISYDDVFAIARSLYGKQESINPYLKTKNQYDFKLSDFNFTSNICSAYVYSDKKKMECLSIQLYQENSTIASGPKNGANFAAYISSSIADSLIDLGLFNSFDDILQSDIIFSAVSNDSSYSFSINNIYLNNESEHWSREEDLKNNLFCNHFASWNKDAIFSYCPKLIRMDEQVLLSSDIRGGYGNLDCLSKSAIMNTSKNISITLHHNAPTKFSFGAAFDHYLYRNNYTKPIAVASVPSSNYSKLLNITINCINNGVDLDSFNSSLQLKKRKIDFLCVGRFVPIKNQMFILKLIKKYYMNSNTNFCFLGDGPLLEECKAYVKENHIPNVSFEGFVDDGNRYMANSKVLLMPSLNEGNPMVVNEALASGMMVVGSDVGGIHDLLVNLENCFLCEVNNEDSFYLAMERCLKTIKAEDVVFNVKKSDYSIDHTVDSYFEIFGIAKEVFQ